MEGVEVVLVDVSASQEDRVWASRGWLSPSEWSSRVYKSCPRVGSVSSRRLGSLSRLDKVCLVFGGRIELILNCSDIGVAYRNASRAPEDIRVCTYIADILTALAAS